MARQADSRIPEPAAGPTVGRHIRAGIVRHRPQDGTPPTLHCKGRGGAGTASH